VQRLAYIVLMMSGLLLAQSPLAGEVNQTPHVAFSSKFRSVDYLFTDRAETQAIADGANYDIAVREVGWDLLSAVGRACNSVKNIQAIFIDRINFKERHSLVVLGVLADLEFLAFNVESSLPNTTLKELVSAFEREHVSVIRLAEASGVELLISNK
jgi:hypothetical protein